MRRLVKPCYGKSSLRIRWFSGDSSCDCWEAMSACSGNFFLKKILTAETASTEEVFVSESKLKVYDALLPLECVPSPGFSRPPPKLKFEAKPAEWKTEHPESIPVVLPLAAPALAPAFKANHHKPHWCHRQPRNLPEIWSKCCRTS